VLHLEDGSQAHLRLGITDTTLAGNEIVHLNLEISWD
jgi:hypothetical protein